MNVSFLHRNMAKIGTHIHSFSSILWLNCGWEKFKASCHDNCSFQCVLIAFTNLAIVIRF